MVKYSKPYWLPKNLLGFSFFQTISYGKKIVGSDLPDKDLLIGFDILHLVKNLHITPTGIKLKQMFLPYTDVLRLYTSQIQLPFMHPPLQNSFSYVLKLPLSSVILFLFGKMISSSFNFPSNWMRISIQQRQLIQECPLLIFSRCGWLYVFYMVLIHLL